MGQLMFSLIAKLALVKHILIHLQVCQNIGAFMSKLFLLTTLALNWNICLVLLAAKNVKDKQLKIVYHVMIMQI
jgi:hypothetical protein